MKLGHHHRRGADLRSDDERGYVLLLGAALMVGLLLLTSIVVDVGALYNARRTDQNAADVSALAAAQDLADTTTAAATAVTYANSTLGTALNTSRWDSCLTDPGALPNRATGSNCVSYNATRNRVRVRIPDQYYKPAFAQMIGINQMRHSAFALAGITQRGFGGVLPFGMPAGAGSSEGYACIKANAGGQTQAPCNGPDSGNFGTIDITQFGSEDHGTVQSCGSGEARTVRIPNNIAVGSDHQLSIYTSTELIESTACASLTPLPNAALTETGNLSGPVESGLLTGLGFSDGGPARLQRSDPALLAGAGRTRIVSGAEVDDNGLWSFIPTTLQSGFGAGGDVPESCERDQFVNGSGTPTMANLPTEVRAHVRNMSQGDRLLALLTRCFAHYMGSSWGGGASAGMPALTPPEVRVGCGAPPTPCTDPVFGLNTAASDSPDLVDIQYTPRFAYVPELTDVFPSGTSQAVRFKGFRPVFIQRIALGSGSNITNFDPGVDTTAINPTGSGVREVTLFVFPKGMLPGRLDADDAAFAIGVNRFVQLLR